MKRFVLIALCSLLSLTAHSQFVTYEAVPSPEISISSSNPYINYKSPAVPKITVINSEIITAEALCVQTEGDSFSIDTKVIVENLSNGITSFGLIGIKQGQKWNSINRIQLISISQSITQAKSKEEKDFLLNLSDFSYFAILGEESLLLFK